jgi:sugar lactone lactonase YvrE
MIIREKLEPPVVWGARFGGGLGRRAHTCLATASGLQKFDVETGVRELLAEIQVDNPFTRSNDGRTGRDGSFWFGTMGWNLEPNAGRTHRLPCRHGRVDDLARISHQAAVDAAERGGLTEERDIVE